MKQETATFAAGCFWGAEDLFRKVPGVLDVVSGYAGGTVKNPTYEQVCGGTTGHAESVQVTYDTNVVTYEALLKIFWENHDPTQVNRQGPDIGEQYRSIIFYHSLEQKEAAERTKQILERAGIDVATQIVPAEAFWRAEEYHQRYDEKHGRVCPIIKSPAKGIL